jgi:ABC-2 type transport system ATP-binding protein
VDVIEVERLRKEYRKLRGSPTKAVDGLDLRVPEGGVFGFLGPNGAGKTTTIRCLLGLVRPSAGRTSLLGADGERQLHGVLRRVGSIVETPTLYPRFTARRNLELLGRLDGIGPKAVSSVLEQVGLGGREDDLVKNYSLGMKQRLGLGAALLKDPSVLILDEPANGLDPAGIKEVRDLIRSLGSEGRTVFVSSHILSEVQQMCDRVAILNRGRFVAGGSVDEVLARGQTNEVVVKVPDPARGLEILRVAGFGATSEDESIRVALPPAEAGRVTEALARHGVYLSELRPAEVSLEDVFLQLTGDGQGTAEPAADGSS